MNEKGREFKGIMGGANYDRLGTLFGHSAAFYQKAAKEIPLQFQNINNMRILDIGCGTASFGLAVADMMHSGEIYGVDLSEEQLSHARHKAGSSPVSFKFHKCSMDELPFEDGFFDAVVTCMAMHEASAEARRGAIQEISRVLKTSGIFSLIDWNTPRFGLMSIMWLPFLLSDKGKDNWKNTYPELCKDKGLLSIKDVYINSLIRCQVFRNDGY